jgi:hypothetical protein
MAFQDLVAAAQKRFPDLQIKYKDQSWFMKLLGTLLFFNKGFMTSFTTTIGSTIYFPNETFIKARPISAEVILLHELVHVKDGQKCTKPLFSFLYLSPQILTLLCIPLFLISWKLAVPLMLLFAAPIPSFFRMLFERRAYMASLYVMAALGKKMNFDPKLDGQSKFFSQQFKGSFYYFMWPFSGIDKKLNQAVVDIQAGKRPFEDPVFDILDELVTAA